MKQDIILSLRQLSLLLLFMGSLFSLSATPIITPELSVKKSKTVIKDDSTKIIFSNWLSEMKGNCVYLNNKSQVVMTVNVITKTDNIDQFPDLHYKYSFNNSTPAISNKITASDLAQTVYNGDVVYRATFIHYISYDAQCVTPETILAIDYDISLVTPNSFGGYEPYPVIEHIDTLFPDNTAIGSGPGDSGTDMGTKVVCCTQLDDSGTETRRAAPQLEVSQVRISPNPFSEELSVETTLLENTIAVVRIFDLTGKVWYQQESRVNAGRTSTQSISTAHFPPGLYFYKVNEETPVKILKVE